MLREEEVPAGARETLGARRSPWIGSLVSSVIGHGAESIGMDTATEQAFSELHAFMYEELYLNPTVKGEESKAEALLDRLFRRNTAGSAKRRDRPVRPPTILPA